MEVAPHQTVAAPAVNIQARRSGDDHAAAVGIDIEETFEPIFP
jgi:hypothetical protein